MSKYRIITLSGLTLYISLVVAASTIFSSPTKNLNTESSEEIKESADTTAIAENDADRYTRLTEDDYREVAEMLDVEPAAIKAIVEIEAGTTHQGFHSPGKPIINFDLSMFRQFARKNGVNLSRYSKSHSTVFQSPNARRYGSTQAGQQERLRLARSIDNKTAIEGTFWGMFQIGGFNWKLCGCSSIDEFVERMSDSERSQLEMFAVFIKNIGLDKALRKKDWATFARVYNGASYANRGYHTRMAAAYARHAKKK